MKSATLTLLLVLMHPLSHAAPSTMRCGRELISVGDHKLDVLHKCGEPTLTERRIRIQGQEFHYPLHTLDIDRFDEVTIEEWTYNFGPRNFMQSLIFENGILKEIHQLGYGY